MEDFAQDKDSHTKMRQRGGLCRKKETIIQKQPNYSYKCNVFRQTLTQRSDIKNCLLKAPIYVDDLKYKDEILAELAKLKLKCDGGKRFVCGAGVKNELSNILSGNKHIKKTVGLPKNNESYQFTARITCTYIYVQK